MPDKKILSTDNTSQKSLVCMNCGSKNTENYCMHCGQKVIVERYTLKKFFTIILDAFNVHRGIIYSFKSLLLHPGKVINDYLNGRTKPYFNPLNYLLIAAGLYAFLILWLNIFDDSVDVANSIILSEQNQSNPEVVENQKNFIEGIKGYINFIPLLMIPFASLITFWFFRYKKLFYGEYLIVNSFLFAQGYLLAMLFMPVFILFPGIKLFFGPFLSLILIIYLSYAFGKIFRIGIIKSIVGALLVYLGGMLLFYLLFMIMIILTGFIMSLFGLSLLDIL